jgi:hypothetical protein
VSKDDFDHAFPLEPDEITRDGNVNPDVAWRIPEDKNAHKTKKEAKVAIGNVGKAMQAAAAKTAPAKGSGAVCNVTAPPAKRMRRGTGPK